MESIIWNGQGPLMIGTYDPSRGTPEMGYLVDIYSVGCGNRKLTTTPNRQVSEIKESCSGQRMTLKEIETGKSLDVSLEMIQFDARTLAIAFFGRDVLKPGGTVTDEILPELKPGDYFFTKSPKISSLVVTDSGSTPVTYVEGTHYKLVSPDHGRCQHLAHPTGHTEPLKMDYAYADYINIAAFSATSLERGLIFSGVNGDGQHARVTVPRITLAMSGDFSWFSDEPAVLSLGGKALYAPELQDEPDFAGFMRIDALPAG